MTETIWVYGMKLPRFYIDTSVIGGCLDEEFAKDSIRIVEAAKNQRAIFVLSDAVFEELLGAPQEVQDVLSSIPEAAKEIILEAPAVTELQDAYLEAKILGPKSLVDAMHVAFATIARVDAIVSWNFKHIVRYDKIKAFNQVNFQNGYGYLQILSPKEILFDEQD
jgi:predicted nucleic acid-binding protein